MGNHRITPAESERLGCTYKSDGAAWSKNPGDRNTGIDLTAASIALGGMIDPDALEYEPVKDLTDYRLPEMRMGDTYGQ